MSNFQCPHCGMTNIDCGRDGYKTPKEMELEAERDLLLNQLVVLDDEDVTVQVTQKQFEEYNRLKAENEELKKQLMQKDEVNTFFNTLDWDNDPCKICPQKNCLAEIEALAKHYSEMCNGAGGQSMTLQSKHLGMAEVGRVILQKIKEVKGNG